jgi:hypothetical protein
MSRFSFTSLTTAGVLAAVVALGAVACGPKDTGSAAPSGSGTAASSSHAKQGKGSGKQAAGSKAKPAFKGSGTFQVGTDIQPGTYRTTGNDDGLCYWERAKDASGGLDSTLANDNVTGSSYVTIKKTDKIFKSTDCKDWYAAPAKQTGSPKTSMSGDGMYKVGIDIQPGTYKSTGNAEGACYWERSKDALHGLGSITGNDNVTGTALVTVRSSDAYFKSQGCGDWHKTG